MRTEIKELHQRLGTTTVYVTHDQIEAMTMGDRIAILKDGDLQQVGTPLELYEQPANLFVARFIGTPPMNVLRGVVDGGRVRCGEAVLAVPDDLAATLEARAAEIDARLAGLHSKLFLEANPIPVKWALAEMGLIEKGIRLPLTWFSDNLHQPLREAMQQAGVI